MLTCVGRGDRIRTYDLYVPNVALYQTELHPVGLILWTAFQSIKTSTGVVIHVKMAA